MREHFINEYEERATEIYKDNEYVTYWDIIENAKNVWDNLIEEGCYYDDFTNKRYSFKIEIENID